MTMIKIRVNSLEDAAKGIGVFPEVKKVPEEVLIDSVGILEGGTAQGKASLMFLLKTKTGKEYIAQLTPDIFRAIGSALTGAEKRFADEIERKKKGN